MAATAVRRHWARATTPAAARNATRFEGNVAAPVNHHFAIIEGLEDAQAVRCVVSPAPLVAPSRLRNDKALDGNCISR